MTFTQDAQLAAVPMHTAPPTGVGQTFFLILAAAIPMSALHKPPFQLGQTLIAADLLLFGAAMLALPDLARAIRSERYRLLIVVGCWLMSIGYLIGMTESTIEPRTVGALLRDALPPLLAIAMFVRFRADIASAWRLANWFSLVAILVALSLLVDSRNRSEGTFENPNYAASFCLIGLVFLLFADLKSLVKIVGSVTLLLGIAATGSFGTVAGLGAIAGLRLATIGQARSGQERSLLRLAGISVFIGGAVLAYRATRELQFDAAGGLNSARLSRSGGARGQIWSETLDVIERFPFGVGFSVNPGGEPLFTGRVVKEPHNDLLSAFLNGGFIAGIGILTVLLGLFLMTRHSPLAQTVLFVIVVSGVFRQVWNFRHFWLALAIAMACCIPHQRAVRRVVAGPHPDPS